MVLVPPRLPMCPCQPIPLCLHQWQGAKTLVVIMSHGHLSWEPVLRWMSVRGTFNKHLQTPTNIYKHLWTPMNSTLNFFKTSNFFACPWNASILISNNFEPHSNNSNFLKLHSNLLKTPCTCLQITCTVLSHLFPIMAWCRLQQQLMATSLNIVLGSLPGLPLSTWGS
jgi:hypothetical protein